MNHQDLLFAILTSDASTNYILNVYFKQRHKKTSLVDIQTINRFRLQDVHTIYHFLPEVYPDQGIETMEEGSKSLRAIQKVLLSIDNILV